MISEYSIHFGQDSVIYVEFFVYMLLKCVAIWITTSVILTSANTATEQPPPDDLRIYVHGGRPVRPGEFPFLVLLDIALSEREGEDVRGICSGSIPSPTTVLTAAHCDTGAITAYAGVISSYEVGLSNSTAQVRGVRSVTKPRFPQFYDIMICHVNQSWLWTNSVAPVALQLSETSTQPSFVVRCRVLGFGQTKPEGELGVAHTMDQLIGSGSQCLVVHPFFWFFSFWMCSIDIENKTMCQGDSGGPTLCTTACGEKQWAVNMAVSPADKACAPTKTVNIYIITASFRNWILSNIKDLPTSAGGVPHCSMKILMYKVLPYQPIRLLLLTAVELLYLH